MYRVLIKNLEQKCFIKSININITSRNYIFLTTTIATRTKVVHKDVSQSGAVSEGGPAPPPGDSRGGGHAPPWLLTSSYKII